MTALTVRDDPAQYLAGVLADRIAAGAREIALSGGTTPRRAYELLAERGVGDARLWLVDERCVPGDHPDSNARMIREAMGEGVRLVEARGELGPEDAAWLYARDLVAALGDVPVLDVVVLGLGEDGHTASLFPRHPQAFAAHAPVIGVRGSPKPPPERITLTLPVIDRARHTVLMATGESKREPLARVRAGDDELPPARLRALDEIVCDVAASAGPRATA
ncbi:MAG TPA: 6-phosphogluconolactonase [Solirubrobacteraceae bacterium]|nr:6-phosphogluconolactonase [Solirubrobacteraceae bacterium]